MPAAGCARAKETAETWSWSPARVSGTICHRNGVNIGAAPQRRSESRDKTADAQQLDIALAPTEEMIRDGRYHARNLARVVAGDHSDG